MLRYGRAVFSIAVFIHASWGFTAESARPNILFIAVDDLRPDLGVYGHPLARTPHIDRLAAGGTTFLRAYCQEAVCSPSRASIMTGLRPDATGVWNLYTRFRDLIPDVETLPQFFHRRGYATTAFGKIFHGQEGYQDPQSWSEPATLYRNDISQAYFLPENQASASDGPRPATGLKMSAAEAADVPDERYPDGKIARAAVDWLRRRAALNGGQPFFLAVGFHKPHLPFSAPRQYWDLYDRTNFDTVPNPQQPEDQLPLAVVPSLPELRGYRDIPAKGPVPAEKAAELRHGYLACVSFIDAQVGLLLDELERSGSVENTIVVLWSDHGFHLGERGYWCKATNYELDTRVPLIIRAPGLPQRSIGHRTEALVELVDVYPTLVELAGVTPPSGLAGVSLLPVLTDPMARVKMAAHSQFPRPWELADWRKAPPIMGYTVRTERWRFVLWLNLADGREIARELYDHTADPKEMRNLAGDPRWNAVEAEHTQLIQAHRQTKNVDVRAEP
jgi:iduronate 2-sulfatase